MTVEEGREYLKRISVSGSVLGLESMTALCNKLGNPQNKGKIIHIAGTNGKGSTGALIESALVAAGKKVGRYTSPAVFSYEEIYRINREEIKPETWIKVLEVVKEACDEMVREGTNQPTVFEVETAVAFLYFAQENCDFTMIEVGMGGETDATNVIEAPLLSVITSISKDHTAFLGDTLEKITAVKAGIIKKGCPVVKIQQTDQIDNVVRERINSLNGNAKELYFAVKEKYPVEKMGKTSMIVTDEQFGTLEFAVTGKFQQENIAVALTALKVLENCGEFDVSSNLSQIKNAWRDNQWPGRFEMIMEKPLCIIDGCHNPDAARKLKETVKLVLDGYRIHFVIGVLGDKDYVNIFKEILPLGVSAACITPNNARGLNKERLMQVAKCYLDAVTGYESVSDAIEAAIAECNKEQDMVLVFGSLSYLGEVKEYVNGLCRTTN